MLMREPFASWLRHFYACHRHLWKDRHCGTTAWNSILVPGNDGLCPSLARATVKHTTLTETAVSVEQ